MKKTIQEAMQHINDANDPIAALREYEHDTVFLKYLRIALGVDYKFSPDLGQGYPEFVRLNRDFPDGISDSALRAEHRQFYLYQDVHDIDVKRRLFQFGGMLEVIHYKESDLIISMKDDKFNQFYPNVTYELASSVFPEMFPFEELKIPTWTDEERISLQDNIMNNIKESMTVPEEVMTTVTKPVKIDKRSKEYKESLRKQ